MTTLAPQPRRLLLLTVLAAVLGVAGGGAAWSFATGGASGGRMWAMGSVSPRGGAIFSWGGGARGMAATFGAPLASVVLAIELLLFEFSTRAFVPLVVAASIAGGMHSLLFGAGPLFAVAPHDYAGLRVLPAFVLLGLGAGLLAVVISRGLF